MRNLYRFYALLPVLLACSTPLKAATDALPLTKTDEKAFAWCLSHFPFGSENPWADEDADRPVKQFPPFDMKDMLGPPNLVKETEIAGKLSATIAKYQGLWIWPTVSVPSPIAIFVERLTPTEMTIAMVKRELNSEHGAPSNPDPLRYELKWNGEAFIGEPGDPDEVGYHISISQDGQAMLVVFVTRTEAMPGFCLISSKHY